MRAVRIGCGRRHAARAALVGHQRARIALLCGECSRVAAGIQLNADIAAVDDHDTGRRVVRLRLRAQRAGIAAIRKLCGNRTGGKADDTADIAVAAAGIGPAFRNQLAAVRAIRKGCRRILIRADTGRRAVADTHIKGTSLDRTLIVAVLKGGRICAAHCTGDTTCPRGVICSAEFESGFIGNILNGAAVGLTNHNAGKRTVGQYLCRAAGRKVFNLCTGSTVENTHVDIDIYRSFANSQLQLAALGGRTNGYFTAAFIPVRTLNNIGSINIQRNRMVVAVKMALKTGNAIELVCRGQCNIVTQLIIS